LKASTVFSCWASDRISSSSSSNWLSHCDVFVWALSVCAGVVSSRGVKAVSPGSISGTKSDADAETKCSKNNCWSPLVACGAHVMCGVYTPFAFLGILLSPALFLLRLGVGSLLLIYPRLSPHLIRGGFFI